ncbi:MAG: serine hydrolase domain-containing protein [Planctomycetota bacterium]
MMGCRRVTSFAGVAVFVVAWSGGCLPQSSFAVGVEKLLPTKMTPQLETVIDLWMQQAIDRGDLPGAVIVAADRERIRYAKALGHRLLDPIPEPMTLDSVFDLASLTKPVATATAVMVLVDRGELSVDDLVINHWPEFANVGDERGNKNAGKPSMRLKHLLLHTSGLTPDNALSDYQQGSERAWRKISGQRLRSRPGERFAYSDVGFLVLQRVVEIRSGVPLDEFVQDEVFSPLGMTDTVYRPSHDLRSRIAPTEKRRGSWIRGEVHDPRAFELGGVAGHAGLFSTAADLIAFGRMMLRQGRCSSSPNDTRRIFSVSTWKEMTKPRSVGRGTRTFGWDHRSPYSSNRGSTLSEQAFGHGGFTGTVLWIDPARDFVFVFLSSRLHPDGRGKVNALAGKIATQLVPNGNHSVSRSEDP